MVDKMKRYARIDNGKVVEFLETDGNITEMFHPSLVWVPCINTVQAGDAFNSGVFSRPSPFSLTFQQKVQGIKDAVQAHLDAPAQALGYDDLKTACTYAGDEDPIFDAQGQSFKSWRSKTWRKCYEILAEVEAEKRTEPTIAELLAELPSLNV